MKNSFHFILLLAGLTMTGYAQDVSLTPKQQAEIEAINGIIDKERPTLPEDQEPKSDAIIYGWVKQAVKQQGWEKSKNAYIITLLKCIELDKKMRQGKLSDFNVMQLNALKLVDILNDRVKPTFSSNEYAIKQFHDRLTENIVTWRASSAIISYMAFRFTFNNEDIKKNDLSGVKESSLEPCFQAWQYYRIKYDESCRELAFQMIQRHPEWTIKRLAACTDEEKIAFYKYTKYTIEDWEDRIKNGGIDGGRIPADAIVQGKAKERYDKAFAELKEMAEKAESAEKNKR